jgi:hypothetical protein
MTIALGKDGWDEYVEKEFPEGAKSIMDMPQVEPIVYKTGEDWEALTRKLVDELACT